jgi:hypothetical protein
MRWREIQGVAVGLRADMTYVSTDGVITDGTATCS